MLRVWVMRVHRIQLDGNQWAILPLLLALGLQLPLQRRMDCVRIRNPLVHIHQVRGEEEEVVVQIERLAATTAKIVVTIQCVVADNLLNYQKCLSHTLEIR